MVSPSPHPSTSAVDHAAQVIRERVGAGELVPGQRLVEPDLAADLGVSRATLREAFSVIESGYSVKIPVVELYYIHDILTRETEFIQEDQEF